MANFSILTSLIDGVQRSVDLSANTLVVGTIKVGGGSGTDLTKTILDNLVILQSGGDANALHHHDSRYYTQSQVDSLVGDVSSDLSAETAARVAADSTEATARTNEDLTFLKLDGSRAMTAALDMGTHKITNVTDGASAADAVNFGQLSAVQTAVDAVASDLADEVTRATAAEAAVASDLADEVTRATGAETTLQNNIDAEETARIAADAALQASIDAVVGSLSWRPGAFVATSDADLNAAADGTALSSLLPFSDDDTPYIVLADFEAGMYILSKNGASSKVFKVIDNAGTLEVTQSGVDPLAVNNVFLVQNDLPDSPDSQEGLAIYSFNGDDLIKVGDFDWSLATGIDLSGDYTPTTGVVSVGDSIELAIAKIVGNLAAEVTRATAAEAAVAADLATETTNRTNADTALQTAIDNEVTRATAAEAAVASDLSDEVTRATAAEAAIASDLSDEVTRATAAEGAIASDLSDEVTRATNAEDALDARIDVLEAGSGGILANFTAGEAFAANTSFAVRFAVTGEVAGRIYKADRDATTNNLFYVFGIARSASSVSAGGTIQVYAAGSYTLGSSDTPFASGDIGKAVYLNAAGAFSITPPTTVNHAVFRIGTVQDTNKIYINAMQLNGIN